VTGWFLNGLHEYFGAFWAYENITSVLEGNGVVPRWDDIPSEHTALENAGIGYGWTPGVAQVHAGTAERTQQYMESTYPGMMPWWLVDTPKGLTDDAYRIMKLASSPGEIYYMAANLRWLADQRTGTTEDHTGDLSNIDMVMIYTIYRCSIRDCYGTLEDFQTTNFPNPAGRPGAFRTWLSYYDLIMQGQCK